MADSNSDLRANPRYRCRCDASLDATEESWPAHLLNISSSGALLAVIQPHKFQIGQRLTITIEFEQEDDLYLTGKVAHIKEHYVGMRCDTLRDTDRERLMHKLKTLNASSE